ncbi:MAG: hypothetical protein H6867_02330 [Rhodospirillales bacterium]|nr:hypothetical protein [Rhodospirillales bacterium]MCB9997026.1 hypothetical protein [Rhodospirillales bacterium]
MSTTLTVNFIEGAKDRACRNDSYCLVKQDGDKAPETIGFLPAGELDPSVTIEQVRKAFEQASDDISANYVPGNKAQACRNGGWHIIERTETGPQHRGFISEAEPKKLDTTLADLQLARTKNLLPAPRPAAA